MGERFFDELARSLATPMPRRRVVRLMGAALVAGMVPSALRPSAVSARAVACTPPYPVKCSCPGNVPGSELVTCCWSKAGCYCPKGGVNCCGKPSVWNGKECVIACKPGRVRCGSKCCEKNERCRNPRTGLCAKCAPGQEACGKKCCAKSEMCCEYDEGICCKKRGSGCCGVGPAGKEKMICCNEPNECATVANTEGTIDQGERELICCPPNRQVRFNSAVACCPPGYKGMGKLIATSGLCCKNERVCGSTCCRTAGEIKEFEEQCCNGACRRINIDSQNCGRCGNVCPEGTGCVMGVCK